MKVRPVQYFTAEHLEYCRSLSTEQICRFVEDFRKMVFRAGSATPKKEAAANDAHAGTADADPTNAK
ncbi:MAG: hypothetical protein AAGD10_10515 [Myxococcota bacterium]